MNRYCFLYNPSTNRRRSISKFNELKKLTRNWEGVTYKTSKSRSDLRKLATEAAKKFEIVVACGGDGTVKEVATSLITTDAKLGVVPMGSGNDFSKSLGLPSPMGKVLEVLKKGRTKAVDVGKCNNFYFINTLGFGFDGTTNLFASQSSIRIGKLRYILAALRAAWNMETFFAEISIDKKLTTSGRWLMNTVANGRIEGGNFTVASHASLFDGKFTLLTIPPVSKWILPFILPFFVAGKAEYLSLTRYFEANCEIGLRMDRNVCIHADGEQIVTDEKEFLIEILPGAIDAVC